MVKINPDVFRNLADHYHKIWLAERLLMHVNQGPGIDLFDNKRGVELKARHFIWSPRYTIHAHQRKEYPESSNGRELFLAFMRYRTKNPISRMHPNHIKSSITWREVKIVPFSFISQYPVNHGRYDSYIYVVERDLPKDSDLEIAAQSDEGMIRVTPEFKLNKTLEELIPF